MLLMTQKLLLAINRQPWQGAIYLILMTLPKQTKAVVISLLTQFNRTK